MTDSDRYAVVCANCGIVETYGPRKWLTAKETAESSMGGHRQSHAVGALRVEPVEDAP